MTPGPHFGGFTRTPREPSSTSSENAKHGSGHPRGFGTKDHHPIQGTAQGEGASWSTARASSANGAGSQRAALTQSCSSVPQAVRSLCTALKQPATPAAGDCRAGRRPPAGPALRRPKQQGGVITHNSKVLLARFLDQTSRIGCMRPWLRHSTRGRPERRSGANWARAI